MDKYPNIIGRQIFDIDFSSKEESHVLQDKISLIFNTRLLDEMDSLFNRILPSNRIIKLDTLSIDIGDIGFDSLESELPNLFIQKLEQELMLILLHDNAALDDITGDIFTNDKKGNYLQLLEFFLLKGSFPWWVSGTDGPGIPEVLDFLLSNSSLKLKELILRIGQNAYTRKRLVYQFSEQQIKYIIIILEPAEAEFIFDYQQNIVQVQREVILVKNEESDFKRAVWELILSFLIVDRGSHFNRKEFVRSMLIGMAAHFNIDFSELLALFAAGLKSTSYELRNTDSLQSIILELFVDDEPAAEIESLKPEKGTEKKLPKLSRDLDLIRYFLTFGSFPWWSSYPDQQSLNLLLTGMIHNQPKTMALIFRNIGQQQFSRKLIVRTFSEEILISIVNLLEPGHVEFVSDYIAEAKDINKRDSKLKVQGQDLAEAVWEFVLEYLLVDRGSEFNRQMFLENNIRNLANRFNVNYSDILTFLVQSIGQKHHGSARHISLIRDLSALFSIREKELISKFPGNGAIEINTRIPELIQSKNLQNVLYYWLKFGHFPWWAGKFAQSSASELLEQLIVESPADALLFFKFSGQSSIGRRRILNQVSNAILIKLFRGLKDGNKAIRYMDSAMLLFSGSPMFRSFEGKMLEKIAFSSLWDMYIGMSYKSFKSIDFLKSLIINLSLSSGNPVSHIFSYLNSLVLDKQIRTQLNKVFRNIGTNGIHSDMLFYGIQLPLWDEFPDIEHIITEKLKSDSLNQDMILGDKVFDEATYLLRYFLQYNKLPESYKLSSSNSVNSFLKQLLLFLQKNRSSDLDAILNSEKYAAENLFLLHEIFRQSDSIEESRMKNLLLKNLDKNILLFIRQKGGLSRTEKSLIQFIEKFTSSPFLGNNNNIFKLLLKFPSVSGHFAHFFKDPLLYELLDYERDKGLQLPSGIQSLNDSLSGLFNDRLDKERFELIIRKYNLLILGGIIEVGNIDSYLKLLLDFLAESNYQLMLKITSSISRSLNLSDESNLLIIRQIPEIDKLVSEYKKMEEMKGELTETFEVAERSLFDDILNTDANELRESEQRQLKEELQEQQQIAQKKSTEKLFSDKDSIYIHNAGLVILHPFLTTYFTRLNMFEKGDFKTEEYRQRAVHLLQFLAYGTESNEEHELVLNKILCNIPIDEPVSAGIVLTEVERAVSGELLNAILTQWDKLKNTSPESFQASFLQRDGALSRIEDNWNLKVETRGYDVLLNTLPWGLGMIKTPWMTEFIYVEWI
ncbi:MAG: contractile injection system tape measure protein [Daejeonella sp.]|uniref:contractile injection system tape measure protein n=1 Tax=Daejeonella sp. TaxID=2805397 RepID=UPI0027373332|nr:contractile injection system tape measure protein [Daejeonella sp.]MDP3468470.1 contractile injection system tape measure protein [Daejeonella sp.]